MTTTYRTRGLNKSATLSSSIASVPYRSKSRTLLREANSLINSTALENIEIEYIKNLQQQVYFLELECNYLRQQLNVNGLQSSLKYDTQSQSLKSDMAHIQQERDDFRRKLAEQSEQKINAMNLLDTAEKNFNAERQLLQGEIDVLRKKNQALEKSILDSTLQINMARDSLDKHHLDAHHTTVELEKLESELQTFSDDNKNLRSELNEARMQLISRDQLIKQLQEQLSDPQQRKSNTEELRSSFNDINLKLSMANNALSKETNKTLKLEEEIVQNQKEIERLTKKLHDVSLENTRMSSSLEKSLKQNETDLLLAKKNADLAKTNVEKLQKEIENERSLSESLRTQVEQFKLQERLDSKNQASLRKRIKELEDEVVTLNTVKINDVHDLKDQLKNKDRELEQEKAKYNHSLNSLMASNKALEIQVNELTNNLNQHHTNHIQTLESHKSKAAQLQDQLDHHIHLWTTERNKNKTLENKIESFIRQETIHNNLIASLKIRITELENEINQQILKEPSLVNQLRDANHQIARLEQEKALLKSELDQLHLQLHEIDRLKQLEDLVNSQKWTELGQLADNMKCLSQRMSGSTKITPRDVRYN